MLVWFAAAVEFHGQPYGNRFLTFEQPAGVVREECKTHV